MYKIPQSSSLKESYSVPVNVDINHRVSKPKYQKVIQKKKNISTEIKFKSETDIINEPRVSENNSNRDQYVTGGNTMGNSNIHNKCTKAVLPVSVIEFLSGSAYNIFLFILVVFCVAGEVIFRKVVATNMYHHRWFLVELYFMLSFLFFLGSFYLQPYIKSFGILLAPSLPQNRLHNVNSGSGVKYSSLSLSSADVEDNILVTSSTQRSDDFNICEDELSDNRQVSFPWKVSLLLALLDYLHILLIFFNIALLPGPLTALLPFTATGIQVLVNCLACDWSLPTPPVTIDQFLGSMAIGLGLYIVILPGTFGGSSIENKQTQSAIIWTCVGFIPGILANLVRRFYLSYLHVDMEIFNAKISFLMIPIGWLLSALAFSVQYIENEKEFASIASTRQSPAHFENGFRCLAGYDSYNGDVCSKIKGTVTWQLILFGLFFIGSRWAIVEIMKKLPSESLLNHVELLGTTLGFVLFFTKIHDLYNGALNMGVIFHAEVPSSGSYTILGAIFTVLGVYLVNQKADEIKKPMDEESMWFAGENIPEPDFAS